PSTTVHQGNTRQKRSFIYFSALFFLSLALILAACRQTAPTKPSPPPPAASPQTDGKNLYAQKCSACHGPNAEGTTVGPAIAGHSMPAVTMQVRNPIGTMPAFPASQLSAPELDAIAEFIASLGEAKAQVQEWEKATTETMHHWMALLAIKEGDAEDAKHHLQDVSTFIKEPMHKTGIERALNMIAQGKVHDAEHEIEEMAGTESPSGITMQRFHLVLAQRSVEDMNGAEVKHHLEHFLIKATESERKIVQEALELIGKGDFHEAEHEIEELLNM
ncbi:MAG: cytochrome c, partial [Chloroflexi bacterium]|nr:cytochrome c [Chloroflexota bacterium]